MWCLCTFGKTLKTLYFECSLSDDGDFDEMFGEERCKLWEAFVHMLPSCPNLEHLHLFEVNHSSYNVPTTLDSLKKLQLKSFNLTNCDNILNTQDFVELLNKRRLHSLKIVHEEEQVETEYIFDIIEFCENLNDSAAGGLGNLTLESISEWEEMQFLGNILDHLPNTRSLAVKFNWDAFGKMSNDAKRMAQVIKQFISRGMQENFAIVFNLTIDRFEERVKKMRKTKAKKEYHFGKRLLDLVTNMGAEGNVCGQNVDVNDWKAKIVRENVTVNISTVIKSE